MYIHVTTSSVSVGNPHIMSVAMEISGTLKKRDTHLHFTEEFIQLQNQTFTEEHTVILKNTELYRRIQRYTEEYRDIQKNTEHKRGSILTAGGGSPVEW